MDEASLKKRWRISMLAFFFFFLIILAGFTPGLGREMNQREDFSYPDDPVWQASDRADEKMPEEYWLVFQIVMGDSEDTKDHNVLDLEVFRETTERNDNLLADESVSKYFDVKFNWQVQQNENSSIWGISDTVRSIMNMDTQVSFIINYTGSSYDNATDKELTYVLNSLFNFRAEDGSFIYRNIVSPDLCIVKDNECKIPRDKDNYPVELYATGEEYWKAKGYTLTGEANSERLFADYPRQRGDYEHYEYWEQQVDSFYVEPLESEEKVNFYSYLAFGLELENQINSTLPLVGISFVLMVLLLSFYFRNIGDVLVCALGLGLLMACMNANSFWLGFPQSQLASMLPILMLALGVDFAIHSLTRWRKIALEDEDFSFNPQKASFNAAWGSIRTLFPALGVATLTTVVAFGTATLSNIPDLFEWGILGPLGIIQAYLIMGVFCPILRSFSPPKPVEESNSILDKIGKYFNVKSMALLMQKRSMPMLVIFLLITIILSPIILGNPESTFDVKDYADNDSRFIQTIIIAQETFTEQGEPGYYLIEGDNLATYDNLVAIDNLENKIVDYNFSARFLGSLPYIVRTQTALALNVENTGYIPKTVDPSTGFPTSDEEIYNILEDVYANGTRNLDGTFYISSSDARATYVLDDGKLTMVRSWFMVMRPDDMYGEMKVQKSQLDTVSNEINEMAGINAQVAGLSYERYVYVLEITDSFQESLVVAIILAFLIVLLVLRDLRLSIITIFPVVAITIWLRGGMVLTGTSINLVTVQISSLAIGLGVDYAIHMVQRVREARHKSPHSSQEEWMSESLDETGNNIAMSAFTDFIGFMVLTLSIMPLFITFGMIMAIMILLSFIAAVFMLPALLFQFGNLEANRPPKINSIVPEPELSVPKRKVRVVKKIVKRRS
ncbi:MAG: RND family transporter [Candidatus Poseidoniales archaeon]